MTLTELALCHLKRRPGRAVILLLGLGVSVATVVGLLAITLTMEKQLGEELRSSGVRVVISPARQEWNFTYAGFPVGPGLSYQVADLPADTCTRLETVDDIDLVAPKLLELAAGPLGDEVLVVGVEWEAERKMRPYWQVRGAYPQGEGEVLLGSHLGELWGIGPGGGVSLLGRQYRVAGVLEETGQEEDGLLFLSLEELRRRLGRPGALTFVEARAPYRVDLADRLAELLPEAEVSLVRNVGEARLALLEQIRSLVPLVTVVAAMAGALLVAAMEFSAVRERTREVGILRALGYRQRRVLQVFLVEVLILSTGAAVVGYGVGLAAARILLSLLDPSSGMMGLYPQLGLLVWAGAVAVGLLGAYFPARHSSCLDPARALRFL